MGSAFKKIRSAYGNKKERSCDEKTSLKNWEERERELVKKMKAGDGDAFIEIFKYYQDRLKAYTLVITNSRYLADEMVQEVFMKIWMIRSNLDPELDFSHYLFKIARNLAFDHLKKVARNERLKREQAENIKNNSYNIQDAFTFREYQDILHKALEELPSQKRLIYEMSRHDGKNNKEIAAELHLSVKTVQNHLNLALQSIKEKLKVTAEITVPLLLLASNF